MPSLTTVTREQRRGETPELQTSPPHPSVLGDAGGQQLDPEPRASPPHPSVLGAAGGQQLDPTSGENKAEGNRENQQETSNRGTGEEHSENMRYNP